MATPGSLSLLWRVVALACLWLRPSGALCPAPCECTRAQRVLCANRGLRAVPRAPPPAAAAVRVLVLAGNFISNVTGSDLQPYGALRSLDLQFNLLRDIDLDTFEELGALEELYLGNNLLSAIRAGTLSPLRHLSVLYANNNRVAELSPEAFRHLGSLVKLRLDKNDLRLLDESVFRHLSNLAFLHLESNRIVRIHQAALLGLVKLQFLNLSDNGLTELRDVVTFSQMRSLVTLLLSGNRITHVGNHVFHNLRKLMTLALSKNRIGRFDGEALKGLSRLKQLAVDSNKLTEVQAGLLDPLEHLEHLDLSDNQIKRVDSTAFVRLAHLKALNLRNNHLVSLAGGVFATNGGLFDLNLSGNNWTCDCRVERLKSWMTEARSQGKLLAVSLLCQYPPMLEGKYLEYVNDTQLWPQGNRTGYCESDLPAEPMESRGAAIVESPVTKEDRLKRGGEARVDTKPQKKKKGLRLRSRPVPGDPGRRGNWGSSLALTGYFTTKTAPLMTKDDHVDLQESLTAPSSQPVTQGRFDMLLQDKAEHHETRMSALTDACQFNRHYISNVSVDDITFNMATVHWHVAPDAKPTKGKGLLFRVLFDRFGHSVRFPRYVYSDGTASAFTLQELRPDSTYITCVESVVGGALCQVAPRDHCVGFVTLSPSLTSELELKHVTAAALVANALLLLLVGGVWLGRALRRRIRSRKSSAHVHVRHMYSTRRPFRSTVATTCVSSEFSGYQSGRPLAEEGDLIQFPGDRFFDSSSARRDDDVMMPRFSD